MSDNNGTQKSEKWLSVLMSFSAIITPFLLALAVGLGSWITRIEQRQFEFKSEVVTKAELRQTNEQLREVLNTFIRTYEQQRGEDRESFGAIMKRIEQRQLDSLNKISKLSINVETRLALIEQSQKMLSSEG